MARQIDPITQAILPRQDHVQQRHTIAALVYFVYGVFYLFGAQYLTSMQATQRGMANPRLFFVLGGIITVLFPLLIYSRFALALSLYWRPRARRQTLYIDFTLLLGLLVIARVIALLRGGLFMKSSLHTAALIVAAMNATCLVWAGVSRPLWVTREAAEP
jgi:hypothetical protein